MEAIVASEAGHRQLSVEAHVKNFPTSFAEEEASLCEGLADIQAGRTRPARGVFTELRIHGYISGRATRELEATYSYITAETTPEAHDWSVSFHPFTLSLKILPCRGLSTSSTPSSANSLKATRPTSTSFSKPYKKPSKPST